MAQIKIYALAETIAAKRVQISDAIHASMTAVLGLPLEKRFQRFFPMEREHFFHPPDRTNVYTILEIDLFPGRRAETKKALIRSLFSNVRQHAQIEERDLEITIREIPRENWGIRGLPGDELSVSYKVEV